MKVIGLKLNDFFIKKNKNIIYNAILFYLHQKDHFIFFMKNNIYHNINGPSSISDGYKVWYYKGVRHGINNDFTIKSWKQKVKQIKREEKLKIFI